jgi:lipopolysaccharide transport system permease protein
MYLTPVIYPMPKSGTMELIMKLNPMATLLVDTRNWFTSQSVVDLNMFLGISAFFLVVTIFSILVFRISMPMIIERIGS